MWATLRRQFRWFVQFTSVKFQLPYVVWKTENHWRTRLTPSINLRTRIYFSRKLLGNPDEIVKQLHAQMSITSTRFNTIPLQEVETCRNRCTAELEVLQISIVLLPNVSQEIFHYQSKGNMKMTVLETVNMFKRIWSIW